MRIRSDPGGPVNPHTGPVPRIFVALGLFLTATVALISHGGPAQAVTAPKTLAYSRAVSAGPVHPGFPIDFVAVTWEGSDAGHDGAAVRLLDASGWGRWIPLAEDGAQAAGQFGSALIPAGKAQGFQVRGIPASARAAKAVALNTTDGPLIEVGHRPAGAAAAAGSCRSRADWGADESLMTWAPTYYAAQVVTVHHTDTANGDQDPAATVRAIYRYHAVDRAWGDIGYQYVIDQSGVIYEGRHSGTSASCLTGGGDGSDFGHDDSGRAVTAAHVSGMNSGNLGVALLGSYSSVSPPAPQRAALEDQLAALATRHRIDPERLDYPYVNPVNGAAKTIPAISGHRDWLATDCPGGTLYGQLPAIRSAVRARMTTTTPPPITLSVTGAKVKGVQTSTLRWSGATTATVDIERDGALVLRGTANDGTEVDRTGKGAGTHTYRVCEAGSARCSPPASVTYG